MNLLYKAIWKIYKGGDLTVETPDVQKELVKMCTLIYLNVSCND